MKIAFFEVRDEEREYLQKTFPDAVFVSDAFCDDTRDQARDAEVLCVFVGSEVRKDAIDTLPNLKCIITRSTGYDHIDIAYAKEKGIPVYSVPGYGERTVAEFTFALLLTVSRKIFDAYRQSREDDNFEMKELRGIDLFQKTIGVVGTGRIGMNVIKIAKGFGMNVIAHDPYPKDDMAEELGYTYVSLDELLAQSDVVTLHVPYMKETHHLLNAENLPNIKKGSILINTARGELIDTEILLKLLVDGHIAGAGLDVLEGERELKEDTELLVSGEKFKDIELLMQDHALIDMPQVVVTPHIAFYSKEAEQEILDITISNIQNFQKGNDENNVAKI